MKNVASTLYPFVPSGPDFQADLAFLEELGFKQQWQHPGLVGLRFGGAYFMLQEADIPDWQNNQMVTYEVMDLEAYYAELDAKKLPARFPGTFLNPPKDFPWGREMHIRDPGGVCWHVRQASLAPVRFGLVAPQFVVDDLVKTAEFYRDSLGFTIGDYFLDPPVHVILTRDVAQVFLAKSEGTPGVSNRKLKPVGIDAYFRIRGVEALHASLLQTGVKILEAPVTRVYGMRELVIEDCNGFVLVFGEEP